MQQLSKFQSCDIWGSHRSVTEIQVFGHARPCRAVGG